MDAIASRSDLREIHPRVKMIYTGITLAICLWASNALVSILLLGLNTVLITLISKAPVKSYRKVMQIPLVFLLFTALGMMIHIPWTTKYLVSDAIRIAELMLRVWAGCSSMFFFSFIGCRRCYADFPESKTGIRFEKKLDTFHGQCGSQSFYHCLSKVRTALYRYGVQTV